MKKILYLALAGLSFAACNNKPTADIPTTQIDTTNHTGSIDSSGMSTNSGKPSIIADSSFLADAHEVGTFEVEAGKLALKNSQDAQVKEFANKMITDHTAMGKDVESVAAQKNITLPLGMGDDLKKEWNKLSRLNGKPFNKEYASVNVKGHKDTIDEFEKTSQNKDCSPEVQQLAAKALPTLKMHKKHADMLKSHVNMGS